MNLYFNRSSVLKAFPLFRYGKVKWWRKRRRGVHFVMS